MTFPPIISRSLCGGLLLVFLLLCSIVAGDKKGEPEKQKAGPSLDSETLTFRVPVQEILLHVLVLGPRDEPLQDLTADDFKVYEDGKLLPLRSFSRESYLPGSPAVGPAADVPKEEDEVRSGH